jgi:hypothetical protein
MKELSDTYQKIKESLYDFIDGKYDDIFTKEQLELTIEISFILNHITITDTPFGDRKISFLYNNIQINQNHSSEDCYSSEEQIISIFRNQDEIKNCLKQFLRDTKINKILPN